MMLADMRGVTGVGDCCGDLPLIKAKSSGWLIETGSWQLFVPAIHSASLFQAVPNSTKLVCPQCPDGIYGGRTPCGNDSCNECRQPQDQNRSRHHVESALVIP